MSVTIKARKAFFKKRKMSGNLSVPISLLLSERTYIRERKSERKRENCKSKLEQSDNIT